MQRHCEHCMQKVHRIYKYTVQRREGLLLLLELLWSLCRRIEVEQGGRAQKKKCTNEEMCNELTWRTEHKKQKNRQRKSCVQEGNEADRVTKCNRTVMSLVSHY